MGNPRPAPDALLFTAVTASDPQLLEEVVTTLAKRYGPVHDRMGPFDFSSFTDYYEKEMGSGLSKIFLLFANKPDLENTARYKHETNRMEEEFRANGGRRVNIDPGFLTLYNLTLLSTKGFSHRVYLADSIYAEVTLLVKDRKFTTMEWTYADYMTAEAQAFLERGRQYLKKTREERV